MRYLPQVVNYKELKRLHKNLKRRKKQTTGQKTTVFVSKNINKERLNKAYTKSLEPNYLKESIPCSTYMNLNHRMNCCKFNLSRDIEKNSGPNYIDPSKTIHAPYSQGDVNVFG